MNLHYLQHVPFEDLGYIEQWAADKKIAITCTKYFAEWQEPILDDIDFLVIMGGPMGVHDENKYPWLVLPRLFYTTKRYWACSFIWKPLLMG